MNKNQAKWTPVVDSKGNLSIKPTKHPVVILHCRKNGVYAINVWERTIRKSVKVEDLNGLAQIIMCASDMDFPEQYTSNKEVIALAKAIRQSERYNRKLCMKKK